MKPVLDILGNIRYNAKSKRYEEQKYPIAACTESPWLVQRGEGKRRIQFGAAYRTQELVGYDGCARYCARVLRHSLRFFPRGKSIQRWYRITMPSVRKDRGFLVGLGGTYGSKGKSKRPACVRL